MSRNEEKIVGRRAILEAIAAGKRPIRRILVSHGLKGMTFREIQDKANYHHIPVEIVERKKLDAVVGTPHHQGVVAIADPLREETVSSLLVRSIASGKTPLIVLLEGITDPQNIGAIIRTCEAAGVDGLILSRTGVAPLDRATTKASAGAVEHLPIVRVGNVGRAVSRLIEEGLRVYAADPTPSASSIYEIDLAQPAAVVFGSEGKGISAMVRHKCHESLFIPMTGKVKNLNVSAAAAVVLFEAVRQRTYSPVRQHLD